MKEAKVFEKQLKPTRKRQGKHTSSLPDAAAESSSSSVAAERVTTSGVAANVTPDHNVPTDALVPDVTITTGNVADDTHRSRGPSKQKSSHTQPNAKRSKSNADEEIDVNRCCACFGMYADNAGIRREWLQCRCSRWIHEDCIDDDDVDIEQSIFCPLC